MILLTLGAKNSRLEDALNDENNEGKMIALFLRCIAKALGCQSLPEMSIQVLTIAESSKWFKQKMLPFMLTLQYSPDFESFEKKEVLSDAIFLFKIISEKMPTKLTSLLGYFAGLEAAINALRSDTTIVDDDLWAKFTECMTLKDEMLSKPVARDRGRKKKSNDDEYDPPDDFRDIPVYPISADVQVDHEKKLHLPHIKKTGKYRDLGIYLDVQFRLLREDFICPLREGVQEYQETLKAEGTVKKVQDLRLYNNVNIISPKSSNSGLCHRVSFDTKKMQHVRWEVSKRLIFGSLVALSSDQFKTVIFATVAERDPKNLKNGIIDLKFETSVSNVDVSGIPPDTRFIMAETTAYFESFKHVLRGLQHIQEGQMPFEQYIVRCEKDVKYPAYLRRHPRPKYDLRVLIDDNIVLRGEKRNARLEALLGNEAQYKFTFQSNGAEEIVITNLEDWPTAKQLHLDDSQFRAVQMALTREFVITQGPPGTGKTYIGLKIAKALLHNYSIWNRNAANGTIEHRPMLIVCYTNHALDQFLESIIEFYKGDVLRVGGRSASEKLKDRNISNYRMKLRAGKELPSQIYRARRDAHEELRSLSESINRTSREIEFVEREVVHEDVLQPFMNSSYADLRCGLQDFLDQSGVKLSSRKLQNSSAIVEWLGYGTLINVVHGNRDMENVEMREIENAVDEIDIADDGMIEVEDDIDRMMALRDLDADFDDILNSDVDDNSIQDLNALALELRLGRNPVALNVSEIDEKTHEDEGGWQTSKKQRKAMKKTLRRELRSTDRMTEDEIRRIVDVWDLTLKDKWRLYRYWTRKYSDNLRDKIRRTERALERASVQHQEILLQEDKEIMQRATVIGMTTTGAAKYQSVLQEIGPRIIIVEEAAEVLEGHVVTTLSRECQHLILIGDHKQLRPNPTVYKLAKDHNLDLSLFERMINNGMDYECLELQHRMRPQISGMMRIIYPDLKDHPVVLGYPDVKGVSQNMYFIDHDFPETTDEDLRSHSNTFEAEYLVALCRYLLLQGYDTSQITILTLYTGQLFELRRHMPKEEFQGVRVTVVDNFQGEENDVILMSLVRSNEEGKIGFLKIENRVCVALSRAKHGLFVIGNMTLMEKGSSLWNKVVRYAKKENIIGHGLTLQCKNHPNDDGIVVEAAGDFKKAPQGGCMKPCQFRLKCGHTCAQVCHILGSDHADYQCRKPCPKKMCEIEGHFCQKKCYQKCGDCLVLMEKTVPKCGHSQSVPCYLDPAKFSCRNKCEKYLPCGHTCTNLCGEPHTTNCQENVLKRWACGHRGWIPCFESSTAVCMEKCKEVLKCGHICSGTCGKCYKGKLHVPCEEKCERPLVCEHQCPDFCSLCPPCLKPCENRCKHSRCQEKCGSLCVPCMEPCEWVCQHYRCTRRCGEPCNRQRCNRPCRKLLRCGHPCIGLCGEPCPRFCRVCHREVVQEIFFGTEDEPDARFVQLEDCGHIIEVTSLDQWMDTGNTGTDGSSIQLRACPKCKTAIRKNMRYGNIVKQSLLDIEKVKRAKRGNAMKIQDLKRSLPTEISRRTTLCKPAERNAVRRMFDELIEEKMISETELVAMDTRVRFLERIAKLEKDWGRSTHYNDEREQAICDLDTLRQCLFQKRKIFSEQEIDDIQYEIQRISRVRTYLSYKDKIKTIGPKLSSSLAAEIRALDQFLLSAERLTERRKSEADKAMEELQKEVPMNGLGVSDDERVEILKAIGLNKGHWFKCPRGIAHN